MYRRLAPRWRRHRLREGHLRRSGSVLQPHLRVLPAAGPGSPSRRQLQLGAARRRGRLAGPGGPSVRISSSSPRGTRRSIPRSSSTASRFTRETARLRGGAGIAGDWTVTGVRMSDVNRRFAGIALVLLAAALPGSAAVDCRPPQNDELLKEYLREIRRLQPASRGTARRGSEERGRRQDAKDARSKTHRDARVRIPDSRFDRGLPPPLQLRGRRDHHLQRRSLADPPLQPDPLEAVGFARPRPLPPRSPSPE